MKLSELKEAAYGARLYKMPSDEEIQKEVSLGNSNFADLKQEYATLWKTRRSLNRQLNASAD